MLLATFEQLLLWPCSWPVASSLRLGRPLKVAVGQITGSCLLAKRVLRPIRELCIPWPSSMFRLVLVLLPLVLPFILPPRLLWWLQVIKKPALVLQGRVLKNILCKEEFAPLLWYTISTRFPKPYSLNKTPVSVFKLQPLCHSALPGAKSGPFFILFCVGSIRRLGALILFYYLYVPIIAPGNISCSFSMLRLKYRLTAGWSLYCFKKSKEGFIEFSRSPFSSNSA